MITHFCFYEYRIRKTLLLTLVCSSSNSENRPKKLVKSKHFFADDVDSRKAENLLEVMEQIDDDCAKRGIHFVKVSEDGAAEQFGVARLPSLVFFKNDLPSLYEGT